MRQRGLWPDAKTLGHSFGKGITKSIEDTLEFAGDITLGRIAGYIPDSMQPVWLDKFEQGYIDTKEGIAYGLFHPIELASSALEDVHSALKTPEGTAELAGQLAPGVLLSGGAGFVAKGTTHAAKVGKVAKAGKVGKADNVGKKHILTQSEYKTIDEVSANDVNTWFREELGYSSPYTPDSDVEIIELRSPSVDEFVRVYDGEISKQRGSWIMRKEDILGLTPEEIANKFALPSVPKYVCDVELAVGDLIRLGQTNANYGYLGGGIQADLYANQSYVGKFINEREIGNVYSE